MALNYPACSSIVARRHNACVLHYRADTAPVRAGELVLIDAGCELDGYRRTSRSPGRWALQRAAAHHSTTWCWPAKTAARHARRRAL